MKRSRTCDKEIVSRAALRLALVFTLLLTAGAAEDAFAQGQDGLRVAKSSQNSPDDPRGLLVYKTQIDRLKTAAQAFKGGTEGLYVGISAEEWGYRAISATARKSFLEKIGPNMSDNLKGQLSTMLDDLKPQLQGKIPLLRPDPKNFGVSAPALEGKMKGLLKPGVTVHRSGMASADWSVTMKASGVPDYRSRYGFLYIRDKDADHPFCEVVRYFFRENFDGKKYGATEVAVSGSYLCACP